MFLLTRDARGRQLFRSAHCDIPNWCALLVTEIHGGSRGSSNGLAPRLGTGATTVDARRLTGSNAKVLHRES